MPQVCVLGEIEDISIESEFDVSLTFTFIPGNSSWSRRNGVEFGETSASVLDSTTGIAVLNHPLDIIYDTSTSEGWPVFAVEAWQKSPGTVRQLLGCGSVWVPTISSNKRVDIPLWRPKEGFRAEFEDILLPPSLNLKKIRESMMNPYLRVNSKASTVGVVNISFSVVSHGFNDNGVAM